MIVQQVIAVVMILASSLLTAWASGDIAFPAILGMLGLLGVRRRFTWDIRPERQFITPLLLLLLAVLFSLHCHYAHVRADQAAAFAWQTIARYFLASMILILFLRPRRTEGGRPRTTPSSVPPTGLPPSLGLFHLASVMAAGQVLLLDDRYVAFRLAELLSVTLVIFYAMTGTSTPREGQKVPGKEGRNERTAGLLTSRPSVPLGFSPSCVLILVSALLLLAVNLGWIGGSLLYRHVEAINFLPAWLSRGNVALEGMTTEVARVGFSTSGKLSSLLSLKEDTDTTPVLTLTGDSNPTYLRARAFESYRQSQWHNLKAWESILPEQNTTLGVRLVGRTFLFRLHEERDPGPESSREVIVRHEFSQGDALFTPLGTSFVEAPFGVMMRDDDDIVNSPSVRNRQSYRIGYGLGVPPAAEGVEAPVATAGRTPTRSQLRQMLLVPSVLDPRIRQRANQIFRGCTTTTQKIDAVTKYFHTNYTYALGLEVPADRDPLNYFLLEASSGYCEYFASGAAVLLRLAGVPTRYVTGFLVTERDSEGGSPVRNSAPGGAGRSWIARNRDAHAWVEAWDGPLEAENSNRAEGKWVIVEATTQEGLDDVSLADELVRSAGSGGPFLTQLVRSLYEYGLFGVLGRLLDFGWRMADGRFAPGALVLGGLALGWALRLRWRRSPPSALGNPQLDALHRILAGMDRKATGLGYRRYPGETLHAFADRISRPAGSSLLTVPSCPSASDNGQPSTQDLLADWYRQYANLRYGRLADSARIGRLQQTTQKLL